MDRLGEVAVRGEVARDDASDPRQDALEVEPVRAAEQPGRRARELEDHREPTRAKDPAHLAHAGASIGYVADSEGDGADRAAARLDRDTKRVSVRIEDLTGEPFALGQPVHEHLAR